MEPVNNSVPGLLFPITAPVPCRIAIKSGVPTRLVPFENSNLQRQKIFGVKWVYQPASMASEYRAVTRSSSGAGIVRAGCTVKKRS